MTAPVLSPMLDELMRRARRGMSLGLERMAQALEALGNPHKCATFVHVGGTNGKGSTSAMVDAVARAAGLRTGLYTSPHLCRFAERIRVDGEPVSDEALAEALERAFTVAPEGTFFEIMTLAGFVAFARAGIEFGVLEVGLGGRLDATNVLEAPLCTAVTSIAFDHVAILGDTLAAIAREKAGIFRRGVPVVLGPLAPEALDATLEVASAIGAGPVWRVAREGEVGEGIIGARREGDALAIELPDGRALSVQLALAGAHQTANAAVAAAMAAVAARRFPALDAAIAPGIAAARWPGRLERIEAGGVPVLLDCAHNPHGAEALAAYLQSAGIAPERAVLVFGALADKAWAGMLDVLAPRANRRIYASPKGRAPTSPSELRARWPGEEAPEGRDAIARALELAAQDGSMVVVAGSIYLVGEIRGALLGKPCDPVVAL